MSAKNDDIVYRKLQRYLDSLPIDYPETESGVEIRILKSLFTPQEAEIALKLVELKLFSFIYSGIVATALTQPALALAILTGKQ